LLFSLQAASPETFGYTLVLSHFLYWQKFSVVAHLDPDRTIGRLGHWGTERNREEKKVKQKIKAGEEGKNREKRNKEKLKNKIMFLLGRVSKGWPHQNGFTPDDFGQKGLRTELLKFLWVQKCSSAFSCLEYAAYDAPTFGAIYSSMVARMLRLFSTDTDTQQRYPEEERKFRCRYVDHWFTMKGHYYEAPREATLLESLLACRLSYLATLLDYPQTLQVNTRLVLSIRPRLPRYKVLGLIYPYSTFMINFSYHLTVYNVRNVSGVVK